MVFDSKIKSMYYAAIALRTMELDITDHCNLHCDMCSRGGDIVGDNYKRGQLSLEDIERFIEESRSLKHNWRHIRIIGGEPTLHPQLFPIAETLFKYCREVNASLALHTNGISPRVSDIVTHLSSVCPGIQFENTQKSYGRGGINKQQFQSLYIQPSDIGMASALETGNCWVTAACGVGLASTGYGICCNVHTFIRLKEGKSSIQTLKVYLLMNLLWNKL